MGTFFYGVCHDCKEYIDLDKFYSFAGYDCGSHADIDKEDIADFCRNEGFVYRSLRLQFFLSKHKGHKQGVYTEHEIDIWEYKEAFPWPAPGRDQCDTIDWTDPKAGRLKIETRYGEITLDYLEKGVNCFRLIDGKRIDTLLLPAIKHSTKVEFLLEALSLGCPIIKWRITPYERLKNDYSKLRLDNYEIEAVLYVDGREDALFGKGIVDSEEIGEMIGDAGPLISMIATGLNFKLSNIGLILKKVESQWIIASKRDGDLD